MGTSAITIQQESESDYVYSPHLSASNLIVILEAVRSTARGEVSRSFCGPSTITLKPSSVQWKVVVLDAGSKRLIDGVVREDDILKENVTSTPQRRIARG